MGHDPGIPLPHVPGHEWAGSVVAVGASVSGWKQGDRVTAPFVCGCGSCEQCRAGNQQVCLRQFQPGFTAWGSFAEFVMIEHATENLVQLPDNLSFADAAVLGCRFATSYRAVIHQARIRPGQWVAVHGCGGVGLAAIMIAASCGARVIAIDVDQAKLARARQAGAADAILASAEEDTGARVVELTGGGVHVSIEALGDAAVARQSVLSLRPRGKHVQVGLLADEGVALPLGAVVAGELELLGTHGMQAHCYPEMFGFLENHSLDPGDLVGRTISLEEAPAALSTEAAFHSPGTTVIDRFA
jgi:alcohol dehydrogenase